MAEERLIRVPDWFAVPEAKFPDVAAVLRNPHRTVKKAEAYAVSLGVTAQYGSRLDIANIVNEVLTELKERNLPVFVSVVVNASLFHHFRAEAEDIAAQTMYNVLLINPEAHIWKAPVASASVLHASGFWSTPHPLHPIYHEAGHLFLPQVGSPKRLLHRQVTVASAVSIRAKENGEEFVSEVFAGLMVGVEYDADILGLYKRMGGKRP